MEKVFSKKEAPEDVAEFDCRKYGEKVWIVKLMTDSGLAASNSEARRLIKAGGVAVGGVRVTDDNHEILIEDKMLVKVGKRRFLRLRRL